MYNHPFVLEQLIGARQRDALAAAKRARLVNTAMADRRRGFWSHTRAFLNWPVKAAAAIGFIKRMLARNASAATALRKHYEEPLTELTTEG